MFRSFSHVLSIITCIIIMPAQSLAQSNDLAWIETLTDQLAAVEDCDVGYFIHVKESELAGRIFYEAKAQCTDGRQFDASRTGENEPFKLSKCQETSVC